MKISITRNGVSPDELLQEIYAKTWAPLDARLTLIAQELEMTRASIGGLVNTCNELTERLRQERQAREKLKVTPPSPLRANIGQRHCGQLSELEKTVEQNLYHHLERIKSLEDWDGRQNPT